jgi:hypothetical protein
VGALLSSEKRRLVVCGAVGGDCDGGEISVMSWFCRRAGGGCAEGPLCLLSVGSP